MPDPSRKLSQVCRQVRQRARPAHVVALGAVAAAAFGLVGLRAVELPGPAPVTDANRLRIEVVAPTEPKLSPGPIMEVGELVDGFVYRPAPPAPEPVSYTAFLPWEEETYDVAPPRPPRRWFGLPVAPARRPWESERPEDRDRARDLARRFGFDAPRPDWRAEREARRARLEAIERREREREWDRERARERDWDRDPPRLERRDAEARDESAAPPGYWY